MSRILQSWIGIALLLLVVGSARGAAQTTVLPVIDRPGACVYCEVVADAFAAASTSIDLLLSNAELDENSLIDSLIEAHQRGVQVRVVLDKSDWSSSITAKNRPTLELLQAQGIDARFDDPAVTTHAKLVLIDGAVAILGSSNWNRYAFTDQVQANVKISDRRVVQAFETWFDAIWEGTAGVQSSPVEVTDLASPAIVALPDADGSSVYASAVISLLDHAEASVHVACYRMSYYAGFQGSTANELIAAVVRAANRGLDVRVFLDDCSFYSDSAEANLLTAIFLSQQGVPVRFDAPEDTMHAKMLVIDGKHAVVGSTNWNYYALERNHESSVALLAMPEVSSTFDALFEELWSDGRPIATEGCP